MFSSTKYEDFVQVSSNQKHIFIMFAGVRCGQESISNRDVEAEAGSGNGPFSVEAEALNPTASVST